jgi:hypothetical protein
MSHMQFAAVPVVPAELFQMMRFRRTVSLKSSSTVVPFPSITFLSVNLQFAKVAALRAEVAPLEATA